MISAWGWFKSCLVSAGDSSEEIDIELDIVGGCETTAADADVSFALCRPRGPVIVWTKTNHDEAPSDRYKHVNATDA